MKDRWTFFFSFLFFVSDGRRRCWKDLLIVIFSSIYSSEWLWVHRFEIHFFFIFFFSSVRFSSVCIRRGFHICQSIRWRHFTSWWTSYKWIDWEKNHGRRRRTRFVKKNRQKKRKKNCLCNWMIVRHQSYNNICSHLRKPKMKTNNWSGKEKRRKNFRFLFLFLFLQTTTTMTPSRKPICE